MSWERFRDLLADEPLPAALVDLDALDHNRDVLLGKLGGARGVDGKPVSLRIASKSVRSVAILGHLLDAAGVDGVMTMSPREAAFLCSHGIDDLLVAYPTCRMADARPLTGALAEGKRVWLPVDCTEHVHLLGDLATAAGVTVQACLDVDVSLRPLGSLVHVGVRRSPVRTVADAVGVAQAVEETAGVELSAVLAYEAQAAGLPDRTGSPMDPFMRLMKRRSERLAAERRGAIVAALRDRGHPIRVVNGGGTGTVGATGNDGSVTEVTAGSGFYCPHLFDGYDALPLRPAAFFAVAVARRSDPGFVTCAFGGYTASGSIGSDRLPRVHLPAGLRPVGLEGWGEVQTPLRVPAGVDLGLGDPVIARHAKAGELCERFDTLLLVRGDAVVDRVPTYRGMGHAFG